MAGRGYRYRAWRGGPDPLAPPQDLRRALDALGEQVLSGQGLGEALRELLHRGVPDAEGRRTGLDDLRARAARRRRELARSGRLDGALTRARAQLDQALAAEREELARRPGPESDFAAARLDALPESTAAAVRELADHRWASTTAGELYRRLLAELRRQVLDQQFGRLRAALGGNPRRRVAAGAGTASGASHPAGTGRRRTAGSASSSTTWTGCSPTTPRGTTPPNSSRSSCSATASCSATTHRRASRT